MTGKLDFSSLNDLIKSTRWPSGLAVGSVRLFHPNHNNWRFPVCHRWHENLAGWPRFLGWVSLLNTALDFLGRNLWRSKEDKKQKTQLS